LSHPVGQCLLGLTFSSRQLGIRSGQLPECVAVGKDGDGLLERLEVVNGQEHSRWPAMNSDRHEFCVLRPKKSLID
jgi:hypothetical protein